MKEFDYNIDYKNTLFKPNDKRYRIGRGEQGVLLVRPYTDDICKHWKFKNPVIAERSAKKITSMYFDYAADGSVLPQEDDWATSEKAQSAAIFKKYRDNVANSAVYKLRRLKWRLQENDN